MTQSIFLQSRWECRTQWSQRSRHVGLKWLSYFHARCWIFLQLAGFTTGLYTFPFTLQLIIWSLRTPGTLFQFFHPLRIISASKSPSSAIVDPRYVNAICLMYNAIISHLSLTPVEEYESYTFGSLCMSVWTHNSKTIAPIDLIFLTQEVPYPCLDSPLRCVMTSLCVISS